MLLVPAEEAGVQQRRKAPVLPLQIFTHVCSTMKPMKMAGKDGAPFWTESDDLIKVHDLFMLLGWQGQ